MIVVQSFLLQRSMEPKDSKVVSRRGVLIAHRRPELDVVESLRAEANVVPVKAVRIEAPFRK